MGKESTAVVGDKTGQWRETGLGEDLHGNPPRVKSAAVIQQRREEKRHPFGMEGHTWQSGD